VIKSTNCAHTDSPPLSVFQQGAPYPPLNENLLDEHIFVISSNDPLCVDIFF
jgi:hypothetical protein